MKKTIISFFEKHQFIHHFLIFPYSKLSIIFFFIFHFVLEKNQLFMKQRFTFRSYPFTIWLLSYIYLKNNSSDYEDNIDF